MRANLLNWIDITKWSVALYMYVLDDADVDSLEEAAGDGSVSHQVALGSHLLRVAQTSDTEEGDELAQRAVKWLLLASCQGDTDAKEKLTYCLNNNIGKLKAIDPRLFWCWPSIWDVNP